MEKTLTRDEVRHTTTARSRLKILSLSCAYPNPLEPGLGVFVQRRLQYLADLAELQVVAPFAILQYGKPSGRRIHLSDRDCPVLRRDGSVQVTHPRWFYPPMAGSMTAFWLFLQLVYPLARIRKKFPFEIIDTHFGHPDGVSGALLSLALDVPFTMTLRGNELMHGRRFPGRSCLSWALRRASRVFTVSERLRQFAIRLGADPERVKTIPNGIETSNFFPRDRRAARLKHGLALDRPLILSAGALIERKGHHRIVKALKHLQAGGSRARLVIAGGPGPEGQYESEIRKMVDTLGLEADVRLLGPVAPEAMAEVMSAADVLCLASTREGWPNVVHEALACGTPVVAADVGGVPDMLPDERYGFVVPVNDQAALQRGLKDALEKQWDRPAVSAWGQARSWQQVAGEVLQELQDAAAEGRRQVPHS